MIEINRHIEILLLDNDCVIVPGFGGFMAHHVEARFDESDSMFLPPKRTVGFNPQLTMNDSLLVLSYVETYDLSYPEALRRIEGEVAEIRQTLDNEGQYEVDNVGTLSLNAEGNIEFEPCEAGILSPELYGLGGFEIQPLPQTANQEETAQETEAIAQAAQQTSPATPAGSNSVFAIDDEEEESGAEFIAIKKSWLRNIAAACIAIVAFFSFSAPLGTPTVQRSQIDTGMLTRIMPKEAEAADKAGEITLTHEAPQPKEAKQPEAAPETSYYSIVLASRVAKRNAASYAERLQAKGFKDARVLITANNVKVIYGTYRTEGEAYSELNKLHTNEAFADGWVTKVRETAAE